MQVSGKTYSIREASALTGLPASTLRYYESIDVIPHIGRGGTSGHRSYTDQDLDQIMAVACLAATGMSVSDMRTYVGNAARGSAAAGVQIELLAAQAERLDREADLLEIRRRYVRLKIEYWRAVESGDSAQADLIGQQARSIADSLHRSTRVAAH